MNPEVTLSRLLPSVAGRILPETMLNRLVKALGYSPELYNMYIRHGVGRFMADQIDEAYFTKITFGTIEHGLQGAWAQGMEDNGLSYPEDMMPIWQTELDAMIEKEKSFLDGFIHAMKQGKQRAESGSTTYNDELDQALRRAELWGRRYEDIRQRSQRITASHVKAIKEAGKRKAIAMIWKMGEAEHCDTCNALDGVVAYSWEWDNSGYHPRDPDGLLECHGFRCACTCEPTDLRRSKALRDGKTLDTWIPERIERIKAFGLLGAKLGSGITKFDDVSRPTAWVQMDPEELRMMKDYFANKVEIKAQEYAYQR